MSKLTIETDDSGVITNLGLEALESLLSTVKISLTVAKRKNRKGSGKVANLAVIKFDAIRELTKLVDDAQVVKDFLAAKKKAGSVFSKTVFDRFVAECTANNLEIHLALLINIDKRWRGFRYSWLTQEDLIYYKITPLDHRNSDSGSAGNGNNQGYRVAKANISETIQRFAKDAADGNIPGVYKKLDSGDFREVDE